MEITYIKKKKNAQKIREIVVVDIKVLTSALPSKQSMKTWFIRFLHKIL